MAGEGVVRVRPPRPEDAEQAFAVIAARDMADLGFVDYTLEDVRADWARPATDAWVAEVDGRIAGTAVVDQLGAMVCVAPDRCGRGVGTALRRAVERRMRERGQPVLRQAVAATNEGGRRLLARAGYRPVHVHLTLRADLSSPAAAPAPPPDGAVVRPLLRPTEEPLAHRLVQAAFSAIEDHADQPLDDWRAELLDRPDHVHSTALVLEAGGRMAGVLIGRDREGVGHVEQLAVDPAARGRGYGRALLLACFGRFRAAGLTACELSVHARNAPALGLYASVGLREVRRAERWEKPA